MTVYLNSEVVIYLVEQHSRFGPAAQTALTALAPTALVGSELVRLESLVLPRRRKDPASEASFERFFAGPMMPLVLIERPVQELAIDLRAKYVSLKTPDALHLATAILAGCGAFVTNDTRLRVVTEIRVELI